MVDYSNIPRDSRRVPLETRVQFKFDRFSGFISEYSANISPGGMFIRTRAPQAQGTVMDVEFRLGDGFELIKARAEVVWVRTEDEGAMRPAGMGLRFQELGPGSKELIYRIVDEHIAQGGTPFDVTKRPPDPIPAAAAPLPPPFAPGRDWPPAAPPGAAKGDVFDLPDLEPLTPVAAPRREPAPASVPAPIPDPAPAPLPVAAEAPAEAPSWMPLPMDEPEPEPFRPSEPFPDLFEPPAPAVALDAPSPAPAPMFASTYAAGAASVKTKPRRVLPLAILAAVLLLAVGAFLFKDTLMEMAGLGGGDEVARVASPANRPAPRPRTPAAPVAQPETETSDVAPPATEEATPPAPAPEAAAPEATPPPQPPPAPAPAPAVAADTGPAVGVVEKITWEEVPGGTDVILWGDGAIRSEVYSRTRIDGNPPRELFRLNGIRRPFGQARVGAGSKELLQVRVGYHPGNQLHVVLDLAHPSVQVTGVDEGPKQLRIHLQRR